MTLQEAADQLGVHYMTAYRYVKLGLLYAEKLRGSWVINAQDLEDFGRTAGLDSGPADDAGQPANTQALADALLKGDEAAAWRVVQASVASNDDPVTIHLTMLAPALHFIGQAWANDDVSIAEEHTASTVAKRIIARLGPHLTSPGRRRGTVIVGAAPGDTHSIPTAMFADLIRSHGADVIDLGGSPDIGSFIEAGRRYVDCVVAITITGPGHELATEDTVAALREAFDELPIAIGGGAVTGAAQAKDLGADLWHSDSHEAARLIADAAAARRQNPPTRGPHPT